MEERNSSYMPNKSKLFVFLLITSFSLFLCLLTVSDLANISYTGDLPRPMASDSNKRDPSAADSVNCPSSRFSKVLLVITFNFPFYNNIDVLKKLYSDVFGGIYFCGPKHGGEKHPDVHEFELRNGFYGYVCMAHAIQANPNFQGYLYTNDDIIINWWNFLQYDLNRVWQGPSIVDFSQDAYVKEHNVWMWWDSDMGLKSCQHVYEKIVNLAMKNNRTGVYKTVLDNYIHNGEGRPRCGKGWSDLFYIPGKLAPLAYELITLCYREKLFLEIAVTNIIRMLSKMDNVEILNGLFLPDVGVTDSSNAEAFWTHYNTELTFVHPFKLNAGNSKKINGAIIKVLVRLGQSELKKKCLTNIILT